jgi:leader peptidase (prepilin peptidase) / N-methyltransferase
MRDVLGLAVGLAAGSVIGSASGAVLLRWPAGERLGRPARSRCRGCARPLRVAELIPVVSWLVLRGRCRTCRAVIDPRVVLVEAGTAIAVGGVLLRQGTTPTGLALAAVAAGLVLATATDLERRIIPDRLTGPLAIGVVPLAVVAGMDAGRGVLVVAAAVGAPLALLLLDALRTASGRPPGIGGGDLKVLVPTVAALAVVPDALRVFVLAVAAGAVAILVAVAAGRSMRREGASDAPATQGIPLAPVLLGAHLAAVVLAPMANPGAAVVV